MGKAIDLYLKNKIQTSQKKLSALGYVRVSTMAQMQKRVPSTESQKLFILNYVECHKELVLESIFEDAQSAKNLKRPGFQALLDRIEKGGIDAIIAYRYDRISRDTSDSYWLEKFLTERGIQIIYTNDMNTDTSASGNFMKNIHISASSYEREIISQRTAEKYLMEITQGYHPSGRAPLGYIKGKDKVLEIHEEGASQIREIYQLFLSGQKPAAIAFQMTKKYGLPPERFSQRTGKSLNDHIYTEEKINYILRNPTYAGYVFLKAEKHINGNEVYQLFEGKHEAIVNREEWQRVQKLISKKSDSPQPTLRSRNPDKYALKKLLYCSCGALMTVGGSGKKSKTGDYDYYVCTKKAHVRSFCQCNTMIPRKAAEGIVLAAIGHIFAINSKTKKITEKQIKEYEEILKKESNELIERKRFYKNKLTKLLELYSHFDKNSYLIEQIKKRSKLLESEIQTIGDEIMILDSELKLISERTHFSSSDLNKLLLDKGDIDEKLLFSEKKKIIQLCIEKVTLETRHTDQSRIKKFGLTIIPQKDITVNIDPIKVDFTIYQDSNSLNIWEMESPFRLKCQRKLQSAVNPPLKEEKHFLYKVVEWDYQIKEKKLKLSAFAKQYKISLSTLKGNLAILKRLSNEALQYILDLTLELEKRAISFKFLRDLIQKPQKLHLITIKRKLGR